MLAKSTQSNMGDHHATSAHYGEVVWQGEGHKVIECQACGYKHIDPLPSEEELTALYEDDFYQNDKDQYLKEAQEDQEWKSVEYAARYAVAENLLGRSSGTVLDIGCGPGDFLHAGKMRGWHETGIEPSPVAVSYAHERDLHVEQGFFDKTSSESLDRFDFIHMSEVLEHLLDPSEVLQLAHNQLKDDGVLCVSVPNDFNAFQQAAVFKGDKPRWWVQPNHHLNYFSFSSLTRLLERNGFSVKKKTTNFPMEMFLLMGQNYSGNPSLGRQMHAMRKNFDIALAGFDNTLRDTFYSTLADANLGRLAIVFATKSEQECAQ